MPVHCLTPAVGLSLPNKVCVCTYRMIEKFKFDGTFKGDLVQLPCDEQEHLQLHQVAQSPAQHAL